MKKYAKVIIQSISDKLDKFFTYAIEEDLQDKVFPGSVVQVPFGIKNKQTFGFVFRVVKRDELSLDEMKYIDKIKPIKSIDDRFFLKEESLKLIKFIRDRYLCSYYEAITLFISSKFLDGSSLRVKDYLYLDTSAVVPDRFKKEPYTKIMEFLFENPNTYDKNDLSKINSFSKSSIGTLIKHGIIKVNSKEKSILPDFNGTYEKKHLNEEQKRVYNEIVHGNERVFLLHGVTGSGKTEVYLSICEHFIRSEKDCIILVPEISLTPQMIERVRERFKNDVVVYHSKLTVNERFTEWQKVKNGSVKIAIGTRSALFLPFNNLGCIIVDEEHEGTYKSESDPKYVVKEIVMKYSELRPDMKVLFGSATPSIESYYRCKDGEYKLLKIKNRIGSRAFPRTHIINMKDELKSGNKSIFSRVLYDKISEKLSKGEQVILFLNKRGHSSFVSCRACGYVYKCKSCDITLTYHGSHNHLVCHYCGYAERQSDECPECKSKYIRHFGIGTEKVQLITEKLFPNAKVLRMDFDTTRKKNSYTEIYNRIRNKEVNIIIGTQMIAKGFDFEDVTLVGVLAADISMNMPDYKAYERTFQLLNQVSGRAGRGEKSGEVCIQTYNPDSYVIKYARNNDYDSFYNEEIKLRKMLNYPPFIDILNILFQSRYQEFYSEVLTPLYKVVRDKFSCDYQILGPSTCMISKINDYYRWQIIVKGYCDTKKYNQIKDLINDTLSKCKFEYKVSFDVNPYSIF